MHASFGMAWQTNKINMDEDIKREAKKKTS
jgi:hypothetical protein